jgi:hypothetical protein
MFRRWLKTRRRLSRVGSLGLPKNGNTYMGENAQQMNVEGMKKLLSKLPLIRKEVFGEMDAVQYPG